MIKRLLPLILAILTLCSCSSAYKKEDPAPKRTTVLSDAQQPDEQEKQLPAPTDSQPDAEFCAALCSYLPVGSAPDLSEEYLPLIKQLDYLILNTGVYWNEEENLEISPELDSCCNRLKGVTDLWCTVNPQGELIRSDTAGASIDTPEERAVLVQNIVSFATEYKLSGIDIDWEFPLPEEWEDFSALLSELKQGLGEISLSVALYPNRSALSEQAVEAIDRVHIMAYDQFDQNGFHSTMQTAADALNSFVALGFSPSDLSLGIPAYGRPTDASAQWIFYRDIDPQTCDPQNPNLCGNVFFNSPQLAEQKAEYVKKNGFGGVMVYHLLCDRTDELSLIEEVKNTIS